MVLPDTQVGASCLTDMTPAEEACCTASLQVAVAADGSLRGMTKTGQAALSPDLLLVRCGSVLLNASGSSQLLDRHARLQTLLTAGTASEIAGHDEPCTDMWTIAISRADQGLTWASVRSNASVSKPHADRGRCSVVLL
jgi:hypothetical protein